jgi:hypothetical protein
MERQADKRPAQDCEDQEGIGENVFTTERGNEMSGYKHTPGPWAIEQCGENTIKVFKATDKKRGRIATIKTKDSSWLELDEADAKLIASAPELLEALELCLGTFEHMPEKIGGTSSTAAVRKARLAIAKAKGE